MYGTVVDFQRFSSALWVFSVPNRGALGYERLQGLVVRAEKLLGRPKVRLLDQPALANRYGSRHILTGPKIDCATAISVVHTKSQQPVTSQANCTDRSQQVTLTPADASLILSLTLTPTIT